MPRLTTVIPVYNGERFLGQTLQALGRQTRRPDRVVVVDNCSTDGTRHVVANFKELAVEWRQNEKNLGLFGNLNRALTFAAETDLLHLLTADDLVLPDFFARVLPAFEGIGGRALAFSRFELVDGQGRKLPPWWFIDYRDHGGPRRRIPLQTLLDKQGEMQTVLVPAAILKTNGQPAPCQFREDMPQVADVVFYAEWAVSCEALVEVPEVLCQYRVHDQNETRRNAANVKALAWDEWRAMQWIETLGRRRGFARWLRQQKLRCLFAARQEVALRGWRQTNPALMAEMRGKIRGEIGSFHWGLGRLAVAVRQVWWRVTGDQ